MSVTWVGPAKQVSAYLIAAGHDFGDWSAYTGISNGNAPLAVNTWSGTLTPLVAGTWHLYVEGIDMVNCPARNGAFRTVVVQ